MFECVASAVSGKEIVGARDVTPFTNLKEFGAFT